MSQDYLQRVKNILFPIKVIVWGPTAMAYYGSEIPIKYHFLGVDDRDYNEAAEVLLRSGFIESTLSTYFSIARNFDALMTENPQRLSAGRDGHGFTNLDRNSRRFWRPYEHPLIILARIGYLCLRLPDFPSITVRSILPPTQVQRRNRTRLSFDYIQTYYQDGNYYFPDIRLLLHSFVRVWHTETRLPHLTLWQAILESWVISYLQTELRLGSHVLDGSPFVVIRDWYRSRCENGASRTLGASNENISWINVANSSTDRNNTPSEHSDERHTTNEHANVMTNDVTNSVTNGVTNDVTDGVTNGVTNDVTDGVTNGIYATNGDSNAIMAWLNATNEDMYGDSSRDTESPQDDPGARESNTTPPSSPHPSSPSVLEQ